MTMLLQLRLTNMWTTATDNETCMIRVTADCSVSNFSFVDGIPADCYMTEAVLADMLVIMISI